MLSQLSARGLFVCFEALGLSLSSGQRSLSLESGQSFSSEEEPPEDRKCSSGALGNVKSEPKSETETGTEPAWPGHPSVCFLLSPGESWECLTGCSCTWWAEDRGQQKLGWGWRGAHKWTHTDPNTGIQLKHSVSHIVCPFCIPTQNCVQCYPAVLAMLWGLEGGELRGRGVSGEPQSLRLIRGQQEANCRPPGGERPARATRKERAYKHVILPQDFPKFLRKENLPKAQQTGGVLQDTLPDRRQ